MHRAIFTNWTSVLPCLHGLDDFSECHSSANRGLVHLKFLFKYILLMSSAMHSFHVFLYLPLSFSTANDVLKSSRPLCFFYGCFWTTLTFHNAPYRSHLQCQPSSAPSPPSLDATYPPPSWPKLAAINQNTLNMLMLCRFPFALGLKSCVFWHKMCRWFQ